MTNPRDMTIEEFARGCKNYVRIVNCLHKQDILNVGELVDYVMFAGGIYLTGSWIELIPNLGSKSIKEIKDRLAYFGWFHDGDKWQPPKQYDAPAPTPPAEKTLRDEIALMIYGKMLDDLFSHAQSTGSINWQEVDKIYPAICLARADALLAELNKPVADKRGM